MRMTSWATCDWRFRIADGRLARCYGRWFAIPFVIARSPALAGRRSNPSGWIATPGEAGLAMTKETLPLRGFGACQRGVAGVDSRHGTPWFPRHVADTKCPDGDFPRCLHRS